LKTRATTPYRYPGVQYFNRKTINAETLEEKGETVWKKLTGEKLW
jgi:hypothetical protein